MIDFNPNDYPKNDPIYIDTKEYESPKESFKFVINLIKSRFGDNPVSILDVGCASGAFLFYAKKNLNIIHSAGMDISDLLIKQANQVLPGTVFFIDDIQQPKNSIKNQFDIVTCLGTLAIFDDLESVLMNLFSLIKPGGLLYIHDLINEYPIDTIMRYRTVQNNDHSEWISGLNVRCKQTYKYLIEAIDKNAELSFHPFSMPFKIPQTSDPMRAWTIQTDSNPNQIMVGTMQLLNFMCLEVKKSE
jgi:SAM-dependent methyltransferase